MIDKCGCVKLFFLFGLIGQSVFVFNVILFEISLLFSLYINDRFCTQYVILIKPIFYV